MGISNDTNKSEGSATATEPPPLAYATPARVWPWDVKVILIVGIVWGSLWVLQIPFGVGGLIRYSTVTPSELTFWSAVMVASTIMPALLVISLIGLWQFRHGARRLAILTTLALIGVGAVEMIGRVVAVPFQQVYGLDVPGSIVNHIQNFVTTYAFLIVLAVALLRPDLRALADNA